MEFNETAKLSVSVTVTYLYLLMVYPLNVTVVTCWTSVIDARRVTVRRDGKMCPFISLRILWSVCWLDSVRFASFRYPYVIDSILPTVLLLLAEACKQVTVLVQLDGKNIAYFDFKEEMLRRQKADSASHYITLTYARAGVIDTITFATDSIYEIGAVVRTATNQLLPVVKKEYSFLASFPAGAHWEYKL